MLHENSDVTVFILDEVSKTSSAQVHKFSFEHRNTKVLLESVAHLIKIFPDVKPKVVTTKTHKRIQPIAYEIH